MLRVFGQYDETVVVEQVAIEFVGRTGFLAWTGTRTGRCNVFEVACQRIMLILKANNGSRRFIMATVVDEYGMGGCNQCSICLGRIAGIEWHAKHKTIGFDVVLINGTFIPCTIHCFGIDFTEMPGDGKLTTIKLKCLPRAQKESVSSDTYGSAELGSCAI